MSQRIKTFELNWNGYIDAVNSCLRYFAGYIFNDGKKVFKKDSVYKYKPDFIFGPIRGGLIPAILASHRLDVKMYTLDPSNLKKTQLPPQGELQHISKGGRAPRALLIDDIADSGRTFKKCQKYLCDQGFTVISCAIVLKAHSTFKPDIYGIMLREKKRVIFPYEVRINELKEARKNGKRSSK